MLGVAVNKCKLTLFLCALTEAYRTVPLKPATVLGYTEEKKINNSKLKLKHLAPLHRNYIYILDSIHEK